jgi:hypothetical protein
VAVWHEQAVQHAQEPGRVTVVVVVLVVVLVVDVVADGTLVVLVVVTGVGWVGSVVPANAAPGTTSVAARVAVTARLRATAGRALRTLRGVRCMVPLRCERCRDGCTGTRT